MQLTEDVYLVGGSPSHGFGLSEEMDSHVYLIDGGAELALVDCGMARRLAGAHRREHSRGRPGPARLNRVFLTHCHIDHVGGLAAWQKRYGVVAQAAAVFRSLSLPRNHG